MSEAGFDGGDFHDLLGIEMIEWRDGFVRAALTLTARHLNRSKILHGGVLLTMMDEIGAMAGVWCGVPGHERSSVTVDLTAHFTGQSREGRIFGTGELVSRGRSIYFTRTEITDPAGRVLAYGTSAHKWRRGSELLEGVPVTPAVLP